jgi:hypothetical protein
MGIFHSFHSFQLRRAHLRQKWLTVFRFGRSPLPIANLWKVLALPKRENWLTPACKRVRNASSLMARRSTAMIE